MGIGSDFFYLMMKPAMRSLFWRILAAFWIALLLVAGLSILLGRTLNQDAWVIARYPALKDLASEWVARYENAGERKAQTLLDERRQQYGIYIQVFDENGRWLNEGPPIFRGNHRHRPPEKQRFWRQLSQEYASASQTYLFIYRIPHSELQSWHRNSLLWPFSALGIALVVLTLISLLLTLTITRPINRLRQAVYDLGQTSYQQDTLARLATRRDELGILAQDFNRMGERLQMLISSQRQLLRDVSHELRSPLARLRVALALTERADERQRAKMWPRLVQECDRLEALINEILVLARLDAEPGSASRIDLRALFERLRDDMSLLAPEQRIELAVPTELTVSGWPDMLERAFDNLLRNAERFNPDDQPLEIAATIHKSNVIVTFRDHGPGIDETLIAHLGEPFFRAPNQEGEGHGLGLAIARRAIERHRGKLTFTNHPEGGFQATVTLPLRL